MSSLRDQNLISTPCLPCKQLVVTSNTGPIFVLPWIHPLGCDDPSSLGRVYSRHALQKNCSSVSLVMKYCPILMSFKFFPFVRHCSVDTELIGRNNYAKNCFNCWIICSEVKTPGQWSRCTENRMSAFCEFLQHFVRDMIPSSWRTILFSRIPLLFRTWTNK